MKVYVAGATKNIDEVRRVQQMVRDCGGEITFDWTGPEGEIRSDWSSNPYQAREISSTERFAVEHCDILILVWGWKKEARLLGTLIETGMALALEKDVIVYGEPRESVFWYMPGVIVARDGEQLYSALMMSYEGANQ